MSIHSDTDYERHSFSKIEPQSLISSETVAITRASKLQQLDDAIDKKLISGFNPVYFVTVMGTGISSCILYNFPYGGEWLKICGIIMWAIGIFFFITTTFFFILSVTKCPTNLTKFHKEPSIALFMGCYPMGYTSLLNFLYFLKGKPWIIAVYVLWWIAVALSLYTAIVVFYMALLAKYSNAKNKLEPENLHATLLLPIVTLTVAASSGNIFLLDLPTLNLQLITLFVCYIMWANAIALACFIIASYFWKLFIYKIPPTAMVFTSFLPIGVLGQGAYAILLFGDNSFKILSENKSLISSHYLSYMSFSDNIDTDLIALITGSAILYGCTLMSLFLISFGYFFTLLAIISCLSKMHPFTKNHHPSLTYFPSEGANALKCCFKGLIIFNKGFWAMTFPLGTMSLSNTELWKVFHGLSAFKVVGAMYGVSLILITISCIIGFIYRCYLLLQPIFSKPKVESINKMV